MTSMQSIQMRGFSRVRVHPQRLSERRCSINVENFAHAPQIFDRPLVKGLFRALAAGDLKRLEAEDWQPYRAGDIAAR